MHRQLEDTDQALGWLVHRGLLVRVSSAWTEAVYQLNQENRSEAVRLLHTKDWRKLRRNCD